MRIHCLIGSHLPPATIHTNQGLDFCTCAGCGCDLVRTGRSWRRIPRGFRLVWKSRAGPDAAEDLRHRSLVVRPPSRIGFRRPEGLLGLEGVVVAEQQVRRLLRRLVEGA